jgi:hypothetical protein
MSYQVKVFLRALLLSIYEPLSGIYFKAGEASTSASGLDRDASFLFMVATGSDFNCTVVYGDSFTLTFRDEATSPVNNTRINHIYNLEGEYEVKVTCQNLHNSLSFTQLHHVQHKLTGLRLLTKGLNRQVAINQGQLKIGFRFSSGSKATLRMFINGKLDSGASYDLVTLEGYSSALSDISSPRLIKVMIELENLYQDKF